MYLRMTPVYLKCGEVIDGVMFTGPNNLEEFFEYDEEKFKGE